MKVHEIDFPHGLGDCVYFAHQLPLYQRRGFDIKVRCQRDKQLLFAPVRAEYPQSSGVKVAWNHGKNLEALDDSNHWLANKAMANFSVAPMPDIGEPSTELWREFFEVKVEIGPHLSPGVMEMVQKYFAALERPIVLLHTKGNTFQAAKSVPDDLAVEIYRAILDETGGTLLLLDWDNRVPRIAHGRIKHLTADWKRLTVEELFAAIIQSDLLVGIDSGPLHLCRYTDTPAIGLWFNGHHPAKYSLPRENQVNITQKKNAPQGNKYTRWFYNIVEEQGAEIRAAVVGRTCRQVLSDPRYLTKNRRGKDVMLQYWIGDWMRGGVSALGSFVDRDQSFDLMLRHVARFPSPGIVETGCIRSEEDWRGAGFSTYLFGAYAAARGGRLDSVDTNEEHCAFARRWTRIFGTCVGIHGDDSLKYLRERREPIDLLYLDSWDTYVAGYAEHGIKEIQAAEKLLHEQSMVVYDDTSFLGRWQGKGMLGVPWLIERGWRPVFVGHQTLLLR